MTPTKRTRLTRTGQAKNNTSTSQQSESSEQSLKWNLQSERILSQLVSIYNGGGNGGSGEEEPLFTDVTLFSSDGACIPAHKVILMLSSPFFHKLFTQVSSSHNNGSPAVIVLGNVNASHLRHLLRLIYTSQCSIPSSQLEEFRQIVLQFGVEGLLTSSSLSSSRSTTPKSPSKSQSSSSDVIKVHIIDRRSQPDQEQDNYLDQDSSTEDSSQPSRVPPCKTEPSEETELDDDHLSNFSEEPLSHQGQVSGENDDDIDDDPSSNYVPPKPKPRPRTLTRKSVHTWLNLEPPPSLSQLKSDWRVNNCIKYATFTGTQYYCAQGFKQSCPAEIKSKTLHDGTIFWFKNDKVHSNHKPADYQFGLREEQKEFVVRCLESGVVMPRDIFMKMDAEGIEKPSRIKLAGMLQRYRKKNPDKARKRQTSNSRGIRGSRIRKLGKKAPPSSRVEGSSGTGPRKRGRPPLAKTSSSVASTPAPTTILSTASGGGSGNIYQTFHPNHYPSQATGMLPFPPFSHTGCLQSPSTSTQQHPSYPFQNF